jgi:hypothetical protein
MHNNKQGCPLTTISCCPTCRSEQKWYAEQYAVHGGDCERIRHIEAANWVEWAPLLRFVVKQGSNPKLW